MAAYGFFAAFNSHQKIDRGERSLGWPSAECTVVHSALETRIDTSRRSPSATHEVASITCTYQAKGQEYEHAWTEQSDIASAL